MTSWEKGITDTGQTSYKASKNLECFENNDVENGHLGGRDKEFQTPKHLLRKLDKQKRNGEKKKHSVSSQ